MILAVLQARTSSTRLPGKVLEPILGVPMILQILQRIGRSNLIDGVVLATSSAPSDDELARVSQSADVVVRRGSLNDVLSRFITVVDEFEPMHVVRLTGDNALTDPDVIDKVVQAHLASGADYTSNAIKRTFPRGLDVEVMRADVLRSVAATAKDASAREHVTMGIYREGSMFRLESVTQSPDHSALRWTVDLPQDLHFVRRVYEALWARNHAFGQREIVELGERDPSFRRTEADAIKEGDDSIT